MYSMNKADIKQTLIDMKSNLEGFKSYMDKLVEGFSVLTANIDTMKAQAQVADDFLAFFENNIKHLRNNLDIIDVIPEVISNSSKEIIIKSIRDDFKIPIKGTELSSGYDLFVCSVNEKEFLTIYEKIYGENTWTQAQAKVSYSQSGNKSYYVLEAGARMLIPTGFEMQLPEGFEAQIRPRSGLALKQGLTLLNTPGTIDEDYRGEVGIIVINTSSEQIRIEVGTRIAQMVIAAVPKTHLVLKNKTTNTERGTGGFGHTGVEDVRK